METLSSSTAPAVPAPRLMHCPATSSGCWHRIEHPMCKPEYRNPKPKLKSRRAGFSHPDLVSDFEIRISPKRLAMSIPSSLLTTTCDIYRPFGAGSPLTTGVACRLVPDLFRGDHTSGGIVWSHYLDLNETVDVKDGCTRTVGANAI